MSLSDNIASVLDVLVALTQSSLGVIVMSKSMWHAGIALHGDLVTSRSEKFAILVRLVSAEVKFCGNDVCPRHAFE